MWTKVHGNISTEVAPSSDPYSMSPGPGPRSQTLTRISHSVAIFLGRSGSFRTPVCWLLNLQNAKQLLDPASIWTKSSLCFANIFNYAVLLETTSKELWIIGGNDGQSLSMTSDVLKIPIGLPTLKNLAIDHVARITCTLDQRIGSDQMPGQLRHEIEVCKQEIIGGECVSKCHH